VNQKHFVLALSTKVLIYVHRTEALFDHINPETFCGALQMSFTFSEFELIFEKFFV